MTEFWVSDHEERRQRNMQHLLHPKPGDYWQEQLHGICVVLDVDGYQLIICREKVITAGGWTWDIEKAEQIHIFDFYKWLKGSSKYFWCDVVPEQMPWAVKAYGEFKPPSSNEKENRNE